MGAAMPRLHQLARKTFQADIVTTEKLQDHLKSLKTSETTVV